MILLNSTLHANINIILSFAYARKRDARTIEKPRRFFDKTLRGPIVSINKKKTKRTIKNGRKDEKIAWKKLCASNV